MYFNNLHVIDKFIKAIKLCSKKYYEIFKFIKIFSKISKSNIIFFYDNNIIALLKR